MGKKHNKIVKNIVKMKPKKFKSTLKDSGKVLFFVDLTEDDIGLRIYDKNRESMSIQVDISKLIKFIDKVQNDLKGRNKI